MLSRAPNKGFEELAAKQWIIIHYFEVKEPIQLVVPVLKYENFDI